MKPLHVLVLLLAPLSAQAADAFRWSFDFAESDHGFVSGFADHPANYDPAIYQLTAGWRARPAELGGGPALFISGQNRSDDLWMYWAKRLTGLKPGTLYVLTAECEFATKYATGSIGVGGSPGDGVFFKTGASATAPVVSPDTSQWLRFNLDKGNQASSGADLQVRGTIAKPDDGNAKYVYVTRHHHGLPQTVATAPDGSLWIVFGTDSGYEGETALYYTRLTVWANEIGTPHLWLEPASTASGLRLVWNNGLLNTTANLTHWAPVVNPARPLVFNPFNEPVRFWRLSP